MKKCIQCSAILLPGANFCHKCGTSTKTETVIEVIQDESRQEDLSFFQNKYKENHIGVKENYDNKKEFYSNHTSTYDQYDLKSLFFISLKKRVEDELNPAQYSEYVELFYRNQYDKTLQARAELLNEELIRLAQKGTSTGYILAIRDQTIFQLVNYFVIKVCADLNEIAWKEDILKYDTQSEKTTNINTLIMDFGIFEFENIKVYQNFITMPPNLLQNAIQAFVAVPKEEHLYFIADNTVMNNAKEGFAMSDKAIYWKTPLEKAHRLAYAEITSIKRHKDWLEINGQFFNISKTLNIKLLRLLKYLAGLDGK